MLWMPTQHSRSEATQGQGTQLIHLQHISNSQNQEEKEMTNPNALQMNALQINRNMYGFDYGNLKAGELAGKISFSNKQGHEMTLVLKPEQIQKILSIVSEAMVETTRELADGLTKDIIENTPLSIGSDTP